MRRSWALALAVGTVLMLSGCDRVVGTDGDLTNNWPAMPKAVTPTPQVGVCYPTGFDTTWYGDFSGAVDCTAGYHRIETVYVGSFSGADADRSAPPLGGSASRKAAYQQCQQAADTYLGGAWQDGRIGLGLVLPDDKAWTGGARWYRCDVVAYTDSNFETEITSGTVKDGLRGNRPLAVTCLILKFDGKGYPTQFSDTPCAQSHNTEYIGLYTAPDAPYPSSDDARHKLSRDGCERQLSNFLGYNGGTPYSNYIGYLPGGFDEDQWNLGDRTERCYAVAIVNGSPNNAHVVGSMKGLKGGAPKRG